MAAEKRRATWECSARFMAAREKPTTLHALMKRCRSDAVVRIVIQFLMS